MRVTCPNCGGDHPKWDCKRPAKKSTAARKDVPVPVVELAASENASRGERPSSGLKASAGKYAANSQEAGTKALPVDTNREPSPSPDCKSGASPKEGLAAASSNLGAPTKFDKKAWMRDYMREYMRKRRAATKI